MRTSDKSLHAFLSSIAWKMSELRGQAIKRESSCNLLYRFNSLRAFDCCLVLSALITVYFQNTRFFVLFSSILCLLLIMLVIIIITFEIKFKIFNALIKNVINYRQCCCRFFVKRLPILFKM